MAVPVALVLGALFGIALADFPDCVNGPLANNTVCDTKADPYTRATVVNNIGNNSPGVPRLGLPAYEWWSEALHGVASSPGVDFAAAGEDYSCATSFPQPILMGAAFDDQLIYDVATVVSTEARAFNNGNRAGLNYWTPNINPYKDPRWGRGQETPGEDPFHLSNYVNMLITGLQGGLDAKPYKKIVATCKHYAGYDLEDWHGNERYGFDAIISSQDLREYYLPPFQTCARDSNVQSVMCSYNAVNGVPTCADNYLLQTILREHWNWSENSQWITSDCDAVQNVYNPHNYTSTPQQAAADALIAGTDLDCGTFYPEYLGSAYTEVSATSIHQPFNHTANLTLAMSRPLKAAEEGIVLLKNDGTLPLSSDIKSIAMIGPWATATTQMQGSYYGVAPYLHSPVYAALNAGYSVSYVKGADINSTNTTGFEAALDAAKDADAVIYVGGIDNTTEGEANDRDVISWPATQLDLINQLANLSKPLVVVQMGTMVDSASLVANAGVSSLVWGGYPGHDGGVAIMNILTGKTAPAGRLPVTQYPADYVDQVPMTNMSLRPYNSDNYNLNNPGRIYKWLTTTPTFPFGHGLHYTNFTISLSPPTVATYNITSLLLNASTPYSDLTPFLTLPITVSNTGSTSSCYVALAFLSGSFGPAPYPTKSLVAYTRVHDIAAKSSENGTLELKLGSLARTDESGDLVL
ncbi:glycoside hydrolase family 3 protein [Mollisia scopiformis]|uniref:xylan 1,4-beta-xylosidase n=1 Tax=Mollisia scopiformis TaxID=149040 RepID=A0A132B1T6_MOLSC|nr:glycoside hydrolase family 3 protein [Mollisia scopiformis]KUJ06340.1 glycoside hydrolase family 3 protein [Mollisia scopiformis]